MSNRDLEELGLSRDDDAEITYKAVEGHIEDSGGIESLSPTEASRLQGLVESQMDPETLRLAGKIEEMIRERAPILAQERGISLNEAIRMAKAELLNAYKELTEGEQ
jgi:hypothetical protein